MEQWTNIPGFEGIYLISKDGRVYSNKTNRELTASKHKTGYLRYKLGKKEYYVHRLLAITYIPNPEGKATVNHKNGDKLDNNIDNLEWLTLEENLDHANVTGLSTKRKAIIRTNPKDNSEKRYKSIYQVAKDMYPDLKGDDLENKRSRISGILRTKNKHFNGYTFRFE